MIKSGELRHYVRLEVQSHVLDSNGDVEQDQQTGEVLMVWVLAREMWCSIKPLSGKEFVASQSVQSRVVCRITMRNPPDLEIRPSMRIVHGIRVYNIEGVLEDPDSGLEYVTLPCSRGVSTTGQ